MTCCSSWRRILRLWRKPISRWRRKPRKRQIRRGKWNLMKSPVMKRKRRKLWSRNLRRKLRSKRLRRRLNQRKKRKPLSNKKRRRRIPKLPSLNPISWSNPKKPLNSNQGSQNPRLPFPKPIRISPLKNPSLKPQKKSSPISQNNLSNLHSTLRNRQKN
jgi:hypothetical protein